MIRREVLLSIGPADAFRVWTERVDVWWPKEGHTRSKRTDTTIAFEPWIGGRFFERTADGDEILWGEVLVWAPPSQLSYSWFPGAGEATPTRVDVRFEPREPAGTTVLVEQRRADLSADRWTRTKQGFGRSWDEVVRAFGEGAASLSTGSH